MEFQKNIRTNSLQGLGSLLSTSILPTGLLSKLGVVLGGISVLALIHHAIQFGLSETIEILVDWYDRFLSIALGWIPIEKFLEWLLSIFSVDLNINPHWKHIFVISNVYFMRNAFTYNHRKEDGTIKTNIPETIFVLLLSIFISLIFSGLSGVYPTNGNFSVFVIAWLPLAGFYVYDLTERFGTVLVLPPIDAYSEFDLSRWMAFRRYIGWANERFLAATMFVFVCYLIVITLLDGNGNYGVVIFLLATFLLAIYWISGRASLNYRKFSQNKNIPPVIKLMKYSGTTYLGVMMLGTLMWGCVFLFLNAGLKLAGL